MKPVLFDTKVLQVDPIRPDVDSIASAARWITQGEVVGFPTETVYGLGADATSDTAVRRIYEVKQRPADNPLIAHFASVEDLQQYVTNIPELAFQLADTFWPGPLTMVLHRGENISPLVTQGLDTLAVRIPAHQVALSLIEVAKVPIAAPSANLSGRPSPTQASHVVNDLDGLIPLVLDGGSTSVGVESTVINLTENEPVLLRPGGVTIEELQQFIPELVVPDTNREISKPMSPGMKYTHYSPETELVLLENAPNLRDTNIDQLAIDRSKEKGKTLILCTHVNHTHSHDNLLLGKNLKEIQVNFFAALRLLDAGDYRIGLFEAVKNSKEGFTVMNRVRKAAHRVIT